MTQIEILSSKNARSNKASANLLLVVLLLALPLTAQAGAPAAGTAHASPAAAASAGPASPASSAAPPASEEVPLPQSHVPPFAQVDTNHDGKIEWKEAQAVKVPKKVFEQFDFNHDGALSETEWLFVRLHMTDFTPPKGTTAAPATTTK